ncbi:MAG: DUF4956 domain-containing protein, partial [Mariniblastus sp.]
QIKVKEMTYLFIVVGLAVINALSNKKTSYTELLFTNFFIFGVTFALERMFMRRVGVKLRSQDLVYDKIELLRPDRQDELIADLKTRTGLNVQKVDIKRIDFAKNSGTIVVRHE